MQHTIYYIQAKHKHTNYHEDVNYSARRLIGSRIIESAAYCNQILTAQPLYQQYTKHVG